ncbi:hypothetical protein NKH77_41385 [Streptomyces sp. M19]
MPGLLRFAAYAAAVSPPAAGGAAAVERGRRRPAGVHDSALAERHADAAEWAHGHAASPRAPRVLVRLAGRPGGTAPTGTCCGCGATRGRPAPVAGGGDRPRDAAEAAEEILAVLEPLHAAAPVDGPRAVVELLVDRDALELPVDEWTWPGPVDLVRGVLGAEYPVTVNCPELVRRGGERYRADWRRRWQRLDDGEAVHIDRATGGTREVYGLLMERPDASRAVLGDLAEPVRTEVVQVCLAMGCRWCCGTVRGGAPRTSPSRSRGPRAGLRSGCAPTAPRRSSARRAPPGGRCWPGRTPNGRCRTWSWSTPRSRRGPGIRSVREWTDEAGARAAGTERGQRGRRGRRGQWQGQWRLFRGDGVRRTTPLPPAPPWRRFGGPGGPATPVAPTAVRGAAAVPDLARARGRGQRGASPAPSAARHRPPGTGKSSLARAVAHELGLGEALRWPVNSRTTLLEGLYRYDAIGRLRETSMSRDRGGPEPDIGSFLRLGPLGTALAPRPGRACCSWTSWTRATWTCPTTC